MKRATRTASGRRVTGRPDAISLIKKLDDGATRWSSWPEAALFHFGTRATRFPSDPEQHDRELRAKAVKTPPPASTKATRGRIIAIQPSMEAAEICHALAERRTWRNFSRQPVKSAELSSLLKATFGVQKWGTVKGQGRVALKTSPSAGARHPIEAYVIAANVAGVGSGVYHYDAAAHHLVEISQGMSRARLTRLLANQRYFAGAAAVIVMSAVFARTMWKYSSSRAYRSILIDAGHLGQTFCLAATAMGLAPFCTMAFREADLDPVLGLDGVNESAIYIVGVGHRAANRRPGQITRGSSS